MGNNGEKFYIIVDILPQFRVFYSTKICIYGLGVHQLHIIDGVCITNVTITEPENYNNLYLIS